MTQLLHLAGGLPREKASPEILFFTEGPSIEEAQKRKIPTKILLNKGGRPIFLYRLYKFLKKNRYDTIHTHTINGNFYGRIAGKLAGVPVLLTTVHSHILDELKGLKKPSLGDHVRYRIDLFLSRWSRALVAVSETIRERLIGYGIPVNKIRIIENSVDIGKFKPDSIHGVEIRKDFGISQKAKLVGIIGRMVPLKNHDVFLMACKEVLKKNHIVHFLIVGNGPLMESLQKLVESLDLDSHVIFTGWRTDIERIMPALDILVICSQVEGLNVAILEAMACGKPVVGTDVLGINSVVKHKENGLLVPEGDPTALADAILYIMDNPSEAEAMGDAGRKLVIEKYSLENMVSAYLELYQEVIVS